MACLFGGPSISWGEGLEGVPLPRPSCTGQVLSAPPVSGQEAPRGAPVLSLCSLALQTPGLEELQCQALRSALPLLAPKF